MALARGVAAVMIDLDGTLLDTIADLAAAAERMLAALLAVLGPYTGRNQSRALPFRGSFLEQS